MTTPAPRPRWISAVGYIAARFAFTLVIAVVIWLICRLARLDVPLLVVAAMAIVVQLPLSLVVFRGQRDRATAAMAAAQGRRARTRQELQAALDDPVIDRGDPALPPANEGPDQPVEPGPAADDGIAGATDPAGDDRPGS